MWHRHSVSVKPSHGGDHKIGMFLMINKQTTQFYIMLKETGCTIDLKWNSDGKQQQIHQINYINMYLLVNIQHACQFH